MLRIVARRAHRLLQAVTLACLALLAGACVRTPTMTLNHAEVTGIGISFPPSVGVLMKVYIDVHNPNSYDVAVRAVRGQVLFGNQFSLPVDFRAQGDGIWLNSDMTTRVVVPVQIPVQVALAVLGQSTWTPNVPYHFAGRADVTAFRSLQLEKDDYAVSADGWISRAQMEAAMRGAA